MTETPRIYPCPRCQKSIRWDSKNPWRPFCSERCRLIDLGDWAAERYSVPVQEKQDWEED